MFLSSHTCATGHVNRDIYMALLQKESYVPSDINVSLLTHMRDGSYEWLFYRALWQKESYISLRHSCKEYLKKI